MNNATECQHPASELLPWYVNGSLKDDERSAVEAHIQACAQCNDDHRFLAKLNGSVNDESVAPIVPQPDASKLFAKIDSAGTVTQQESPVGRRRIVVGLIAASFIVAAIAWRGDEADNYPARFETATGSSTATTIDYVLDIHFENNTSATDRSAVFAQINSKAVREELDGYRVVVSPPGITLQELESLTQQIESMPDVLRVQVVAVQIPTSKE